MSFENQTFRKAASDAGIRGKDHRGNPAIDEFSTYYHNSYPKLEREGHGYSGIKQIADQWWRDNHGKYRD